MSDWIRLFATTVIWVMVAIMVTMSNDEIVPLAFILGAAATISTGVIWSSNSKSQSEAAQEVEKHKRRSRVSRLLDEVDSKLDDDEVYELEELLAARRDEAIRRRSQ
jgi:hypothetical protein